MTERQMEAPMDDQFLSELLRLGPEMQQDAGAVAATDRPAIDDMALLRAANRVGTPPLVEPPVWLTEPHRPGAATPDNFRGEVATFVRRYPLPTIALAAGLAYIALRRGRH
ncbi:MAG TPA: hypothetical protein VFS21_32060 [Roseiflexaceae bacterium]|nr:hypothetical protein [Roseiflexaceae bacterium]